MNILICGFTGKMGQAILNQSKICDDIKIVEGFDREEAIKNYNGDVKVFSNLNDSKIADMVVDYSHHTLIKRIVDFCVQRKLPLVVGTTGHNEEELQYIINASKFIPVFKSSNMSQGVFVLNKLIREATKMLENYDIEIIEKHHNQKADSPSGTALMMARAVEDVKSNVELVFGRNPNSQKRKSQEIGIHSIRGGGIVGEHEIEFISESEVISIKHESFSKNVFADGTIRAIRFLNGKNAGFYEMKNLFD